MTKNYQPCTITISGLSERGEGLVAWTQSPETPPKTIAVPYTLIGETVTIQPILRQRGGVWGRLIAVTSPSPERAPAPCRHFGECGGCAVQHIAAAAIEKLKINRVLAALARHRIAPEPEATIPYGVSGRGERRRAVLSAHYPMTAKSGSELVLGFNKRAQHRLVDLAECPVMHPAILDILPPMRQALAVILQPGMSADCLVTLTASGLDVVIRGIGLGIRGKKGKGKRKFGEIGLAEREALATLAARQNLARLIWHGAGGRPELIAERIKPQINMSGIMVDFPPGGFLQATQSGEAMIVAALLGKLPALSKPALTKPVAPKLLELFAGLGSLSIPLAQAGYDVTSFEGDCAATDALSAAQNRAGHQAFPHPIKAAQRDLVSDPLTSLELQSYDILVLDPPRSGAMEQIRQIPSPHDGSHLRHIAYVSCDAESFARDAARLVQIGYELTSLSVIDQFLWSSHVELVAHFSLPS